MDISRYRRILMHDPPWKCILELLEPSNILSHHLPGSDVRHELGAFQGDPLRGVQSLKKEVKTYALIQYYANQSVSDARTKKDMETRIGWRNIDGQGSTLCNITHSEVEWGFPKPNNIISREQFCSIFYNFDIHRCLGIRLLRLHASLSLNKKSKEKGGKVKGYRNKHECLKKDECFGRLKTSSRM